MGKNIKETDNLTLSSTNTFSGNVMRYEEVHTKISEKTTPATDYKEELPAVINEQELETLISNILPLVDFFMQNYEEGHLKTITDKYQLETKISDLIYNVYPIIQKIAPESVTHTVKPLYKLQLVKDNISPFGEHLAYKTKLTGIFDNVLMKILKVAGDKECMKLIQEIKTQGESLIEKSKEKNFSDINYWDDLAHNIGKMIIDIHNLAHKAIKIYTEDDTMLLKNIEDASYPEVHADITTLHKSKDSSITIEDSLTSIKYSMNNFDPSKETTKYSYTSARVLKNLYNTYEQTNEFKIDGYYPSWGQYDGRLLNMFDDQNCGRGIDITNHYNHNYNTVIVGFLGIVGDKGPLGKTIQKSADDLGFKKSEITLVDNWGMLLSYLNCDFPSWKTNDARELYGQGKAQGMLGALEKLQAANPDTNLGVSIGGWTMSEAFHDQVSTTAGRKILSESIANFFQKFSMLKEVSLDWEYPGAPGLEVNKYSDDDGANYVLFVKDLDKAFKNKGLNDIKYAVASSAVPEKFVKSQIPELIKAGVSKFHLMTYDGFGTPWSKELAHHTPLNSADEEGFSVNNAVQYMLKLGVPSKAIYIGVAGYTRNAKNAEITSVSPLKGTYNPGEGSTVGTFESGTVEFYDLVHNYLELETGQGKNGYTLYTDDVAKADFLYSSDTKVFQSVETPKTAYDKAQYVKENKLGGIMVWMMGSENGLLSNAIHEGFDHKTLNQQVDMSKFYYTGYTDLVGTPNEMGLFGNHTPLHEEL